MATTRANLRTAIRSKLKNFPLARTTLTAQISATATSFTLASATNISAKCLLEIDDEVLRVHGSTAAVIDEAMRGEYDSTPAIHVINSIVKVYPMWGWTDSEVNAAINKGITWLGEGMVYTMVPKLNTFLAGFKDFGLPAGCLYPNGDILKVIKYADSDGNMWPRLDWKHVHDRVVFNDILTEDLDVELWIQTAQAAMTTDSAQLDSDKWLEALQLYCTAVLLEEFVANRALYYEYSASLHDRAATMDELSRGAYYMRNQATIMRDALSRPGIPGFASRQKDG